MDGYAVPVTAACAVLLLFGGIVLWVLHLARQSEAETAEAATARSAEHQAAQERRMARAALSAAPTDAALERSLSDGSF